MSEHTRIVFLGTGTDVGKTYVASHFARAWRKSCGPVLALKPIESGLPLDSLSAPSSELPPRKDTLELQAVFTSDAGQLQAAATWGSPPLYGLSDPVSPHLAAERDGSSIQSTQIRSWVEAHESKLQGTPKTSSALSLVETAGGVFSPLSLKTTNFDLAGELDPSFWILVAPDSIGVLHDVGATLRAMHQRPPDLVVLSGAREPDATTGTNGEEIKRAVFPQLGSAGPRFTSICKIDRGGDCDQLVQLVVQCLERG